MIRTHVGDVEAADAVRQNAHPVRVHAADHRSSDAGGKATAGHAGDLGQRIAERRGAIAQQLRAINAAGNGRQPIRIADWRGGDDHRFELGGMVGRVLRVSRPRGKGRQDEALREAGRCGAEHEESSMSERNAGTARRQCHSSDDGRLRLEEVRVPARHVQDEGPQRWNRVFVAGPRRFREKRAEPRVRAGARCRRRALRPDTADSRHGPRGPKAVNCPSCSQPPGVRHASAWPPPPAVRGRPAAASPTAGFAGVSAGWSGRCDAGRSRTVTVLDTSRQPLPVMYASACPKACGSNIATNARPVSAPPMWAS